MAYVPDPTDVTQPVESVFAKTAAAEFRALKAYIQGLVLGSGIASGYRSFARNGNFLLNQRAAGAVTADGGYIVDGWRIANTVNRMNAIRDTATHATVFPQTVKFTVVTPAAPAAGDSYGFFSSMEGMEFGRLLYGGANARAFTLSFKVYSSVVGTYSLAVRNAAGTRSYVTTFQVTSANTWETKQITIPGDTGGVWVATNAAAASVIISLGTGTTYQTANLNVWQAGNFVAHTSQTPFVNNGGAQMFFAEMQMEPGSVATTFENVPITQQWLNAMRYWQSSYVYPTVPGAVSVSYGTMRGLAISANDIVLLDGRFPVPLRADPPNVGTYNPGGGVINHMRNVNTGADIALTVAPFVTSRGFYSLTAAGALVAGQLYEFHYTADSDI